MSQLHRRDFLKGAAAGLALPALAAGNAPRALDANEAIRVGIAGLNGRGKSHVKGYMDLEHVHITHLIDPDAKVLEARRNEVREKTGRDPKCFKDVRAALADKELDVLSIATPNHWHSLMTIWGCQAEKDVYVEKPMSHDVAEGRICVEAAARHKRLVQHGTQNRSSAKKASEIAAVQSGKYGKLLVSKGYCCKPRWSIGNKPVAKPPAHLDFDLWLGPAPSQPYHANLVHYNWHWFWDFGNGDIGNQGVHEMDIARWAIKGATLPTSVWSLGGRLGYQDQGQTPSTQMSVFDYGDALLVFEVRGLVARPSKKDEKPRFPARVGNEFYTTEGRIANGEFHPKNGGAVEPLAEFDVRVQPGGPFGSFINAVRRRDPAGLNANVENAHYSSALCHLANISYRLGEQVPFNGSSKSLGDNKEVYQTFMNLQENLTGAGVKLGETTYRLGRTLQLDAASERFVGDQATQANALLRQQSRKPFEVPEKV